MAFTPTQTLRELPVSPETKLRKGHGELHLLYPLPRKNARGNAQRLTLVETGTFNTCNTFISSHWTNYFDTGRSQDLVPGTEIF